MRLFFLAFVVLFLFKQGACDSDPVIDPSLLPDGGLIIYVPGTGCQLKKYGDGMQQFVWWANKGVFTNIIATSSGGGSSVKFHYYDSNRELIRKTQLFSKTPQHTPEEALEWIRTRPVDSVFTPIVRNFTEPVVANWGGHQYELHGGIYPYFIAKYAAVNSVNEKGERGYLLTITSPEEQAFVTSFLEEQHAKDIVKDRERAREVVQRYAERKAAGEELENRNLPNPEGLNKAKAKVWLGARDIRFEGFWEWEGGESEGEVFYTMPEIEEADEEEELEEGHEDEGEGGDEDEEPMYHNWLWRPRVQRHKNCVTVWDQWQPRGCDTRQAFIIEYGDEPPVIESGNQKEEL